MPVVADAQRGDSRRSPLRSAGHGTPEDSGSRSRARKLEWDRARRRRRRGRRQSDAACSRCRAARRGQRDGRRDGHGRLRRRQPARRSAQALAAGATQGIPRRVRLLVHGLRDRGRPRRQAGHPGREVFVMVGDGSLPDINSEIVTAVQEGIRRSRRRWSTTTASSRIHERCSARRQRLRNELRYRDPLRGRLAGDYIPVDFRPTPSRWGCAVYGPARRRGQQPRWRGPAAETADRHRRPVDTDAAFPASTARPGGTSPSRRRATCLRCASDGRSTSVTGRSSERHLL